MDRMAWTEPLWHAAGFRSARTRQANRDLAGRVELTSFSVRTVDWSSGGNLLLIAAQSNRGHEKPDYRARALGQNILVACPACESPTVPSTSHHYLFSRTFNTLPSIAQAIEHPDIESLSDHSRVCLTQSEKGPTGGALKSTSP